MKPILFNTEMTRAILDGRKTKTRRVVKPVAMGLTYEDGSPARKPPYRTGEILYVREAWAVHSCNDRLPPSIPCKKTETGADCYIYRADDGTNGRTPCGVYLTPHEWRPSIHIPKEAVRLFLRVKDVRVERLQEITEEQAEAEGCPGEFSKIFPNLKERSSVECFSELWDRTIKPKDILIYGWEANPWVWAIEFEVISKDEAERSDMP